MFDKNSPSMKEMELLSAYLDDALSSDEKARFELRLQSSPELQQALKAYRLQQWNLRHLPQPKLPRNFTLTRAEAQAIKARKNWFPVFRTASLASFLLLAGMFIFPLLTRNAKPASMVRQDYALPEAAPAPVPEFNVQVERSAAEEPPAKAEEPAAPVTAAVRSEDTAESALIFTISGSTDAKGLGGGGFDSAPALNESSLASGFYPFPDGPGNLNVFGNAPVGIVIPIEPLYGSHPAYRSGQGTDLQAILAATPSVPPLILGLDPDRAGQVLFVYPMPDPIPVAAQTETEAENDASPSVGTENTEPGPQAATEGTTAVPQKEDTPQHAALANALKIALGAVALLFAGLALYFKKH